MMECQRQENNNYDGRMTHKTNINANAKAVKNLQTQEIKVALSELESGNTSGNVYQCLSPGAAFLLADRVLVKKELQDRLDQDGL